MDLSIKATGTRIADVAVAPKELAAFATMVREAMAAAPADMLALANTVTVTPGGKTFSTIQAAINSITDVGITDSKIIAKNADAAWGAAANDGSTINLYNCTVLGSMSLVLSDSSSHITATDCKLTGPYSPGAVVVVV